MSIINIFWIIGLIVIGIVFVYYVIVILEYKLKLNLIKKIRNFLNMSNTKKIKSSEINVGDRVEILMNKYGIKSTEKTKTNFNLKYLVDSPSYFNYNVSTDLKIDYLKNGELKKMSSNKLSNEIIKDYVYNKKLFSELFLNNNMEYKIKTLEDFYEFQKQNIVDKNLVKYNILLKFFTESNYIYIFVNDSDFIKIKKYEEYDKICELIDKNNDIFLIQNDIGDNEKYYITHGGLSTSHFDIKQLSDTFFKNKKNATNKNLKLLSEFDNLNIYFYVSTQITNMV